MLCIETNTFAILFKLSGYDFLDETNELLEGFFPTLQEKFHFIL